MSYLIGSAAAFVGLIPLLWLMLGPSRDHRWWWMAAGFAVSYLADAVAAVSAPTFVSQLYPVTQAALFVLVLAPRRSREWLIGGLLCCAGVSVAWREAQGLDILLHVVAWGTVAAMGWFTPHRLRLALMTYFAGGAVLWCAYVFSPGWITWGAYQVTRLLGVALWCVAASHASTPEAKL